MDTSTPGNPVQLSFVGRFRQTRRNTRYIDPPDLFPIVKASLQSHYFLALNQVWKQVRGAGIGSQISPALSNLTVTIVKRTWSSTFDQIIHQPSVSFMWCRYVDNRFILCNEAHFQQPFMTILRDTRFYQAPVELEAVEGNELLGFLVDSAQ